MDTLLSLPIIIALLTLATPAMPLEIQTIAEIPNARASMYYDFRSDSLGAGVESTLLRYKPLDLAVGFVNIRDRQSGTASLCLNLDKLNIPNVEYLWHGLNTRVGIWAGYDLDHCEWSYGLSASIITIEVSK